VASLSSDEIRGRLAAAQRDHREATDQLRRLRAAAVRADLPDSPEEKAAAAAQAEAASRVERLSSALASVEQVEAVNAAKLAVAAVDAQDAGLEVALDELERGAAAMAKNLEAYVAAWTRFHAAASKAQEALSRNSRTRADLQIPNVALSVARELARLNTSPPAPGADKNAAMWGDVTQLQSLAGEVSSIVGAARQDLAKAKADRDRTIPVLDDEWASVK
jgi:non-ribosomal peptide synthetase component F